MKMGGTNKIALHFMRDLSQYCNVTLILSEGIGELLSELPKEVHLIIDQTEDFRNLLKADIKSFKIAYLIRDCLYYAKVKMGKDDIDNYKYIIDRYNYISDEVYDCAISYHGQSPNLLLNLLYRIKAKKKCVWIHGEMNFQSDETKKMIKYYENIDHFFFVSNPTRAAFYRAVHFDLHKSTVYYNPIDKNEVLKKAATKQSTGFNSEYINILTVGRLSKEKGQDMIPCIMKSLLDQKLPVRWYLIGDGDDRERIEQLIKHYQLDDSVFVLGTQINPYTYMAECDIYVQPSYTEGYSTTICEAGILGKAIIGTKPSGGIYDQITDGKDGLIVGANVSDLAGGIKFLIENKVIRHMFETNIRNKDFEGEGEINKFLRVLEN